MSEKPAFMLTMNEYGHLLREIRLDGGLTVEQMAENVGCSATSISNVENGFYHPSHGPGKFRMRSRIFYVIADALDNDELRGLARKIDEQDDRPTHEQSVKRERYDPWSSVGSPAAKERISRGLTQREVEEKLGLPAQSISCIERCCAQVRGGADAARDLVAAFYGYDTDEMFDLRGAKIRVRQEKLRARYGRPDPREYNTNVVLEEGRWSPDPEELLIHKRMRRDVFNAICSLPPRHELIIRYGLMGYTLQEIGDHLGVGSERVRQLKAKAERMLRHSSRSRHLRQYDSP